jgi:hypothetical protein
MPSDTYTLTISDVGVSTPADLSVTTGKIADGAVTTAKLQTFTTAGTGITTAKIADVNVTTAKIADGAVTTAKLETFTIAGTGVTTAKIADGAITTAKILDGTIVAGDIANGAVTTDKIGTGTIIDGNISSNTISLGKIVTIGAGTILGNATAGTATVATSPCTAFGFQMLAATDNIGGRSALGLGSMATQASTAVDITGGTISGVTLSGASADLNTSTGLLSALKGGTGFSSYTAGDLLYASSTTALSRVTKGAENLVLRSPTAGGDAPQWGPLNLATDVTGILPTINGGTGGATTDTLTFLTTGQTTDALETGELRWNGVDKTLDLKLAGDVTLQVGQETNLRVHASTTISNGQVVYISGLASGLPAVLLADNTTVTAGKTLGVATQDITSGQDGYVTIVGLVRNLDLLTELGSPIASGDTVWLGTSGDLTKTEPAYPAAKVRIGHIISASDTDGSIHVNIHYDPTGTVNGTGKIGYSAGSGGTVTQSTTPTLVKTNGVTLNTTCGQITTNTAALAHDTTVSFVLTNSRIEAGDVLILNHLSGGTVGSYLLNAQCGAGTATINIRNIISANTTLSEAIVISFVVIRGSST